MCVCRIQKACSREHGELAARGEPRRGGRCARAADSGFHVGCTRPDSGMHANGKRTLWCFHRRRGRSDSTGGLASTLLLLGLNCRRRWADRRGRRVIAQARPNASLPTAAADGMACWIGWAHLDERKPTNGQVPVFVCVRDTIRTTRRDRGYDILSPRPAKAGSSRAPLGVVCRIQCGTLRLPAPFHGKQINLAVAARSVAVAVSLSPWPSPRSITCAVLAFRRPRPSIRCQVGSRPCEAPVGWSRGCGKLPAWCYSFP
jgi:hypothetical protein